MENGADAAKRAQPQPTSRETDQTRQVPRFDRTSRRRGKRRRILLLPSALTAKESATKRRSSGTPRSSTGRRSRSSACAPRGADDLPEPEAPAEHAQTIEAPFCETLLHGAASKKRWPFLIT
jgi:hypothetical protein